MFEPGQPYTGAASRAALRHLHAEGVAFLGTLPDRTFFAPQGDRWSPAEHIRHLRKNTSPVASALRAPAWILRLRFGRGASSSRDFLALREIYRDALAAGGQAGRFAPSYKPPPADPTARRAQIMRGWAVAVDELVRRAAHWSEGALERAWLPHPLLGLLTIREALEFTVYHTSHHLTLVAARSTPGA